MHDAGKFPNTRRPEVAVAGRSNVGKSSLLNYLASHKKLARVSNTPGRTRDINFFSLDLISGVHHRKLALVDLPGYGFAKLSQTDKKRLGELITSYLHSGRPIGALLVLLDIRRDPSDDDIAMVESLHEARIAPIAVITKADKVSKSQRHPRALAISKALGIAQNRVLVTSVHDDLGREELLKAVWNAAGDAERR